MTLTTIAAGLHVNLNLLEPFVMVAELRSFNLAAEKLGRSNSALSNQIKQLEEQLGVRLFDRTTRTVHLTDEGVALYDAARGGFSQIRLGLQRAGDTGRSEGRKIAIACSSSLAWRVMPPVIERFSARYRNISVEVEEMQSSRMARPILSGEVAFGVGVLDHADPDLEVEFIRSEPMVALLPKSYPQSGLSSITLQELAALPLLLSPSSSPSRKVLEAAFAREALVPSIKVAGLRFHTLLAMVEAGQGASVFSALSSRDSAERGFRQVPFSDRKLTLMIGFLKLPGRNFTAAETVLLGFVREELNMQGG